MVPVDVARVHASPGTAAVVAAIRVLGVTVVPRGFRGRVQVRSRTRHVTPPLVKHCHAGEFRGNLNDNPYDPNSVSNPYGTYGSPYSSKSLNNPYATTPSATTPRANIPRTSRNTRRSRTYPR